MSWSLMSFLHDAFAWAGGGKTSDGSAEGHAAAGAGMLHGTSNANDLLGGMVGGFGGPMEWKGAGFGGQAGGVCRPGDGYFGGDVGLGFGAAGSQWSMDGKTGVSGVTGGVAPVGLQGGYGSVNANASTSFYSGVGGSAYRNDDGSGYGVKGSAVPLGMADTNVALDTPYGSLTGHADNAYLDKYSGAASFGEKGGVYNASLSGGVQTGVEGVNMGYGSPSGDYRVGVGAKSINYGYQGSVDGSYDSNTGTLKAKGGGRGGGIVVTDAQSSGTFGGYGSYNAKLGEFSNDTIVDGSLEANSKQTTLKTTLDGMGLRFKDADVNAQFGDVNASGGFKTLGNNNSITDAYLQANYGSLDDLSLKTGFKELSYGNWYGTDLHADIDGPYGANAHAKVGSFGTGFSANDFNATLDKNGLDANLKHGQYNDFDIQNATFSAGIGDDLYAKGKIGEAATDKVVLDDAHVDASLRGGIHAKAGNAQYDEVYLKGIEADQRLGPVYQSHLALGEGTFNHFAGKNVYAGLDWDKGLSAGLEDGHYSFLAGKDIDAKVGIGDGAVGVGVGAKDASALGVDVGKLDFNSTLRNTHLDVDNLGAYGFKSKDIHADANVGALGANVGAKQMDLANLTVGNAKLDTHNFGTQGNASVDKAKLDALNVKGGHAGLSWGGKEFFGASSDIYAGTGVDSAKANWDLMHGQADASFKNASLGGQISNTHINVGGYDIAIPDMGAKLNASGGASVDLSHGAASANFGLGGSSANFAGYEFTVPDWVRASAGVDVSKGAANFNLGGDNGIGADISIADGQFNLDAFGYRLDVDEGIRDVGSAIGDAWDSVTDW